MTSFLFQSRACHLLALLTLYTALQIRLPRPPAPPHTCIVAFVLPPLPICLFYYTLRDLPESHGTAALQTFVVVFTSHQRPRPSFAGSVPLAHTQALLLGFAHTRGNVVGSILMTVSHGGSHCSLAATISSDPIISSPQCLFDSVCTSLCLLSYFQFLVAFCLHLPPCFPVILPTPGPQKLASRT